jgi:hypothetical protein
LATLDRTLGKAIIMSMPARVRRAALGVAVSSELVIPAVAKPTAGIHKPTALDSVGVAPREKAEFLECTAGLKWDIDEAPRTAAE